MQITFRDYIKTFPKLEKEFDNAAMCAMKWIYLYVHLGDGVVKGCHNVPHRYVTSDDVVKYGKDLFLNSKYEINTRRDKLNNIKNKRHTIYTQENSTAYVFFGHSNKNRQS
jgi:hypothetical protein